MNTPSARARFSDGNRSPISEFAAGAQLASPTPTSKRIQKNDMKLQARPEAAVKRLHAVRPAARM